MHLELKDIAKSYGGDNYAVKDVSLVINEGEFVVLLGPSGCGKSTLLRMIAGLETITAGDLVISGKSVVNTHPKERDIAMVFQNYALYPHMTVAQNIGYPLKLRKEKKEEISKRVSDVANLLELGHLLERKPGQLSGGQRQRVAMGRALVRKPSVFLMDEPLSNLDAKLRMQMRVEISELQKSLGITTLYVTHDQIEAMTMADKIVVLFNGNIQQIGSPWDIYSNPENLFVASFMGSPPMNFIAGEELNGVSYSNITIGIRPESVEISEDLFNTDMTGICSSVEVLGSETLVHVSVDISKIKVEGNIVINGGEGASITCKMSGNQYHLQGKKVGLRIPKTSQYLFDTVSGNRLTI
ncbi:sn-glycerol-3-phosphate ABC transporter ATP-binding protein UgpC [Parasalinivibrio latis]|uniref:ABC transporter ATP-binding protein n=1 Tax=Parasalinivibrio latis TaxID=2952610 RepID=UPI0030DE1515